MKFIHTLIFLQSVIYILPAQSDFEKYFSDDKLRFDYLIGGSSDTTIICSKAFYSESNWGGSMLNTIDTFLYGELLLEVFDSISGNLIYSRGYSSLFKEWQTTNEADSTEREFQESLIMPFPGRTIRIEISERSFDLSFHSIYSLFINPEYSVIREKKTPDFVKVRDILINGSAYSKLDLVFIAEGYSESDSLKFFADVREKSRQLFQWDPYSDYKEVFNIYAAFVPSKIELINDSITTLNALNTHFNTFDSKRYLTTEDIQGVRDVLAGIPYDQICIIVNSEKYGGGGIYNYLTFFTSDNEYSEFLFHHEFGHGFVSLADEYYSSIVPYDSYFDLDYEPYQPNITTRISFQDKWENMILDSVSVPTPNLKIYKGVVGLFEGAGYTKQGVYRPYLDCSMKSKINNAFCPVCKKAIEQMILFYTAE